MTTNTLPLPSQAGYRTALQAAKKAGIVNGRNPKSDDLESLISAHNQSLATPSLATPQQRRAHPLYPLAVAQFAPLAAHFEAMRDLPSDQRLATLQALIDAVGTGMGLKR